MKKNLMLIVFVFGITSFCFAQNMQDVVYLKNGSVIRGTIIKQVPNESLKIQTRDGNLFVYKISDVSKITKEAITGNISNTHKTKEYNSNYDLKEGLRLFAEAGYTFGNKKGGRVELLTSAGYQVNQYFYVGGGFGGNYYTEAGDESVFTILETVFTIPETIFTIPVYANIRGYIPTGSSIHPYIDVKPGYGISCNSNYKGGFYMSLTAGVEISKFTIGLGYATQALEYEYDDHYFSYIHDFSTSGFTIKVGLTF